MQKPPQRYHELDALRGVAALTVMLSHFELMWFGASRLPWWVHLADPITRGHEAVVLFFLLSGFVLSVPYLRGKGQSYPVYLLRRILRIYAPYLGALALAVAGAAIWHQPLGWGEWQDATWSAPVDPKLVLAHVSMLGFFNMTQFNTAFWSIVIEMRISLIFPLLFLLVRRVSVSVALLVAVASMLVLTAPQAWISPYMLQIGTIWFLAAFIFGILLATHVDEVAAWYSRLGGAKRALFVLTSFVLFTFGHHLAYFTFGKHLFLDVVLLMAGAVGYLILALNAPWAQWILRMSFARFLGRISYSLYLVHGTVLFALAHVFGRRLPIAVEFVIYIPAAVLLSYGFCVAVEEPFLRLSRRVSKAAYAKLELEDRASLSA